MKLFLALAGINGFIAVMAGAFGAHALRDRLSERHLEVFEIGVRYQMYHALALIGAAWLVSLQAPMARAAGWSFVAGIAIFSGSLYILALTGHNKLGAITPLGGLALLVGWALVIYGVLSLPGQ
ncbi:MAG: DUF423 domain-containing protein [Proteobacteria bacterium]|nr:DUF423 domain-containing protein [Pseudomonadota bacterium]